MGKITLDTVIKKAENVPSKEIGDEGILLNLATGDYFSINEVGLFIWKSIDGKKNIGQIAGKIASLYAIDKEKAYSHLLGFVASLKAKKLVAIN